MDPNKTDHPPADTTATQDAPVKIPIWAHLVSAWPLLLISIGGCVGGALGGAAYGLNFSILRTRQPVAVKALVIVSSGIVAFILWLIIALAINIGLASRQ